MAARRTSGGDSSARARHRLGARHLLCRCHRFELAVRLHHPHRLLSRNYSVFDCGRMALTEDSLNFVKNVNGAEFSKKRPVTPFCRVGTQSFRFEFYCWGYLVQGCAFIRGSWRQQCIHTF